MEFDEKFFEEEIRCGFTVEAMMKKVWAAEIKVLQQIIYVCEKYGLTYYADYGTLLGAVRHKGFVPWDDDIDICLKRQDYMKLIEVLPTELPQYYDVSSIYTSDAHNQPMSCVKNGKMLPLPKEVIEEFYGCPYMVGVDIYALDNIPCDEELAELQLYMYMAVYDFAQRYQEIEAAGEVQKYLPQIEELCQVTFDRNKPLRRQLWQLCDRIGSMITDSESEELTFFPRMAMGDLNFRLQKEWYAKAAELPFENINVMVPSGYKDVLAKMYGNYMESVQGRSAHGYPFFTNQEEYLRSLK